MIMDVKRYLVLCLLCCSQGFAARAQQAADDYRWTAERTYATLFALGRVKQLDTYLSPMQYTGPQVTYLHETVRNLERNPKIIFQTLTQGELSYTHNRHETAHYMGGSMNYDAGWLREWKDVIGQGLNLSLGGMTGGNVGFLYNNRNTNNPAQARAALRLSAAARADYRFRIRRQHLALCYGIQFPMLGIAFSPRYGQSYYDIFDRGHYDHNIVCTHPFNALSLRQQLTFALPVGRATLRVGYLSDLRQMEVNGLKQHQYGRSFLLGYVRNVKFGRNGKH